MPHGCLEFDRAAKRALSTSPKDTRKASGPMPFYDLHLPGSSLWMPVGLDAIATVRAGIQFQPRQKTTNASGGQGHARVGCSVIKVDRVSIGSNGLSAGKDNIAHITSPFVGGLWAKHPRVSPLQADVRPVQVEKG